ncbi:class I SAM-dependent methyltransferase [Actinoplanes sp. Pm04-4]|uniref:Class I SAM-dependent methyltransferase n=1 Tax=Paractinoplanes pyxinae TaxID=2997416 RepID=A0ABT4AUM7_9ACTN|nr:class I SAM-dependent methyltransferase [Actinoplanes pyxinae]MCY1137882.1 class I SAM-dependent methyltransferase [Actinoplanes pyxinae]
MTAESTARFRTPEGVTALALAAGTAGGDPLAAASALRSAGVEPDLAAAALTMVGLRRRAAAKFGADAAEMFFTRAGLEQATRAVVANRRAARLAAAGVRTLADLGCGLGSDALAAARAGIKVFAVDADPVTAEYAAANARALGLADLVTVECADATAVRVEDYDAVFADPARRKAGRGRVFDPKSYSPPWDFIAGLAERVPRTVLKLAPGIDHDLLPPGAEGEWVSVGGDLVEAAFWCGPLARAPRRASLLLTRPHAAISEDAASAGAASAGAASAGAASEDAAKGGVTELTGGGDRLAEVGGVGAYLYDPDPAVVRAHLVAEFADTVGGRLADPSIAYVYTDDPVDTPFARRLAITDVLPFSLKRLRALLRERGVGRLEIRKRGSALEPDQLRKDLRLSGSQAASLVLTRVAGAPAVILCEP